MMKTKKLIAIVCAMAMVLGLFAACSAPTEQPTEEPSATPIVTPTPEEPTVTPEPTEEPVVTPEPTEEPAPTATPYPSIDPTMATSDPATWPAQHEAIIGWELAGADDGVPDPDKDKKECWLGTVMIDPEANHEDIKHLIIPSTIEIDGEEYTVVGLAWDLMGFHRWDGGRGFGTVDNPDEHDCWVETVYIPKTVKELHYQIFYTFGSIENVVFEDISTLESMDVLNFRKTKFEENGWQNSETEMHIVGDWLCWVHATGDVQIPTGVKHIGGRIFNWESDEELYREFIETITIPETVTDIHKRAFEHLDGAEFVFRVKQGSYADTWLQEKGYTNIEYFE